MRVSGVFMFSWVIGLGLMSHLVAAQQSLGPADILPPSTMQFDAPGSRPVEQYTQSVIERLYAMNMRKVNYQTMPLARSFVEANEGRLDGLLGRVGSSTERYPNLLKIDVPLLSFNVVLIVDSAQCGECAMSSLSSVGTVRGFKTLEDHVRAHPLPFALAEFISKEQVLELFIAKRLEGVILTESMVPRTLFESQPNWKTHLLTTAHTYHYVHKKHAELVLPLTNTLSQLEREGWLQSQRTKYQLGQGIFVTN